MLQYTLQIQPCTLASLAQKLKVKPFEVHLVWGWGQWEGKRFRMREMHMYHDPPAYYTEGLFLTFELTVPQVRCTLPAHCAPGVALVIYDLACGGLPQVGLHQPSSSSARHEVLVVRQDAF